MSLGANLHGSGRGGAGAGRGQVGGCVSRAGERQHSSELFIFGLTCSNSFNLLSLDLSYLGSHFCCEIALNGEPEFFPESVTNKHNENFYPNSTVNSKYIIKFSDKTKEKTWCVFFH